MYGEVITGTHVDDINHDIHRHRTLGVLHADEPTFEGHKHQGGGGSPDADEEILPCHIGYTFGTRYNRQNRRHKQILDSPDHQARYQRYRQTLRQDLTTFTANR